MRWLCFHSWTSYLPLSILFLGSKAFRNLRETTAQAYVWQCVGMFSVHQLPDRWKKHMLACLEILIFLFILTAYVFKSIPHFNKSQSCIQVPSLSLTVYVSWWMWCHYSHLWGRNFARLGPHKPLSCWVKLRATSSPLILVSSLLKTTHLAFRQFQECRSEVLPPFSIFFWSSYRLCFELGQTKSLYLWSINVSFTTQDLTW